MKFRIQILINLAFVVALSNISDGEELFAIPRHLVLSVNNSNLKNLISQSLEDLGPWLSLIVVMIYEYLLREDSAWSAYFQVLPTSFDTLMFWSESELSELQASAIVNRIGKQDVEESVLELVAPIIRSNPTLFPPLEGLSSYDGADGNNALLGLAHKMGSLIMAYAFDIEDDAQDGNDEDGYVTDDEQLPKGMVPLADLLNADADLNNVSSNPSLSATYLLLKGVGVPGQAFPGRKVSRHEIHQADQGRRRASQRLWPDTTSRSSSKIWLYN